MNGRMRQRCGGLRSVFEVEWVGLFFTSVEHLLVQAHKLTIRQFRAETRVETGTDVLLAALLRSLRFWIGDFEATHELPKALIALCKYNNIIYNNILSIEYTPILLEVIAKHEMQAI